MIDAGILAYQPWMDSSGVTHPYKEYGLEYQRWNETDIADGYQIESYSFSNITNVVGIDWDFRALLAKTENGIPVYVFYERPLPWQPPRPFNGLNFQISFQTRKTFTASWSNGSLILPFPDSVTHLNGTDLVWNDADYGLGSQIFSGIRDITSMLPLPQAVNIKFGTVWQINTTISSSDASLANYHVDFQRDANVNLVVKNGTATSATGSFAVRAKDYPSINIAYRLLPYDIMTYLTYGLTTASSAAILLALPKSRKALLALVRRRPRHSETLTSPT